MHVVLRACHNMQYRRVMASRKANGHHGAPLHGHGATLLNHSVTFVAGSGVSAVHVVHTGALC